MVLKVQLQGMFLLHSSFDDDGGVGGGATLCWLSIPYAMLMLMIHFL